MEVDKSNHLKPIYFGEKLNDEKEFSRISSVRILNEQASIGNNLAYSAAVNNNEFGID